MDIAMDMSVMVDRIIYTKVKPQWHIECFVTWRCVGDATPQDRTDQTNEELRRPRVSEISLLYQCNFL